MCLAMMLSTGILCSHSAHSGHPLCSVNHSWAPYALQSTRSLTKKRPSVSVLVRVLLLLSCCEVAPLLPNCIPLPLTALPLPLWKLLTVVWEVILAWNSWSLRGTQIQAPGLLWICAAAIAQYRKALARQWYCLRRTRIVIWRCSTGELLHFLPPVFLWP